MNGLLISDGSLDGGIVHRPLETAGSSANLLPPKADADDDDVEGQGGEMAGVASAPSVLLNLLKSIIGAGILGIPLALQRLGYVPGLLVMLVAAGLSFFGLYLLAIVIHRHGRSSTFSSIAREFYPQRWLLVLLDGAIVVKCMGVGMSYLSVVGDVVPDILRGLAGPKATTGVLASKWLWVLIVSAIDAPLVCMRRIDSLKYTSVVGLLGVVYLLGLSLYQCVKQGATEAGLGPIRAFVPVTVVGLTSFSVFVFAFTCHQNLFPIQNEARRNDVRPMTTLLAVALLASFLCYGAFGTLSGLANPDIKDKILAVYPIDEWPYIVARIFYVVLLTFSFPLQTFPTRLSLLSIVQTLRRRPAAPLPPLTDAEETAIEKKVFTKGAREGEDGDMSEEALEPAAPSPEASGPTAYWLATAAIIVVAGVVASLPVSLDMFLTVVGSTSGPVICYFLPALLFLKDLHVHHARTGQDLRDLPRRLRLLRRLAQCLLVCSVLIFAATTSLAVVKIVLAAKSK